MANEITVNIGIAVRKDNLVFPDNSVTRQYDMSGLGGPTPGFVTIGTVEESTTFPELTTLGWLEMKNLDPTNFVEWGFSTGALGGRMEPGEPASFRLKPGATLFLKADTAACKCQINAFED